MSELSAASMESHGRAYPLLMRLHVLQEIESGQQLLQPSATSTLQHISSHSLSASGTGTDGAVGTTGVVPDRQKRLESLHWRERLHFTAPSTTGRSTLLAVRRCLLGIAGLPQLVAQNWLELSSSLRRQGKLDSARIAVRNAEGCGLPPDQVLLQECRILRDSGQLSRALALLEPVEIDQLGINDALRLKRRNPAALPSYLATEERRHLLAERIHLATQLMVESKQKQGSGIIDRYKIVISLNKYWGQAYFDLARYYEFLYHDCKEKMEQHMRQASSDARADAVAIAGGVGTGAGGGNPRGGAAVAGRGGGGNGGQGGNDSAGLNNDPSLYAYILKALDKYVMCLVAEPALAMQVLPRMLTLWLAFTATYTPVNVDRGATDQLLRAAEAVGTGPRGGTLRTAAAQAARQAAEEAQALDDRRIRRLRDAIVDVDTRMSQACNEVSPATWFLCMSQLVSRVLHRNKGTVEAITKITQKILVSYPKQGIWLVAALMFSLNRSRKQLAKELLQNTYRLIVDTKPEDAYMLVDAQKFYMNLIQLAAHQCKDKKIRWSMTPEVKLSRFMVPTQSALYRTSPLRLATDRITPAPAGAAGYSADNCYYGGAGAADAVGSSGNDEGGGVGGGGGGDSMFIAAFDDQVDVASSKAKPKTIRLRTLCGRTVKFLCKQEKDGDLRKDARLMEFNTSVNRLLREDAEGRHRQLRLRTYAVVCLNEECGLLEWVDNTDALRSLIAMAHSYCPEQYPQMVLKDVYHPFLTLQGENPDNLRRMLELYSELIESTRYKPYFHRWFLEQFSDPTAWLAARTTFARSLAVWSIVGHVIGLGDRHVENILMDITNAECVHVDFDCLFDKGLNLGRPEIVPFRLTPNLVDALGATGVEGTFRRTMEVCLSVLRDNKETLLGVLEPFLYDPTVAWGRGGRAQRTEQLQQLEQQQQQQQKALQRQKDPPDQEAPAIVHDVENKEAVEMLRRIGERLSGVYNVMHPLRERLLRGAQQRGEILPTRGVGACREEMLPLSVPGQVQRLVEEAAAPENLVQMYIGE